MNSLLLFGVPLLLVILATEVKTDPPPGAVQRECRDRYFYIWIDRSFLSGRNWSIDASDESRKTFPLTPQFAAMCGFTLTSDKWGNLEIRASFLSCLVQNDNDETFSLNIHLNVENQFIPGLFSSYVFPMTCGLEYQWSSREIVCEENYMEVSVRRLFPGIAEEQMEMEDWEAVIPAAQEAITSVWQIVFQVREGERTRLETMTTTQANALGYGINTTASRVVFRAPYKSNESSVEMIENMPVESIKATVFYKQRWLILLVDSSTACPIGPAILQDNKLVWATPRILAPVVLPANITADIIAMGIDGHFLDDKTLVKRGYELYVNNSVIAIVVPVGAEGGLSKSRVINNTYGVVYSIHLLLEHQWLDHLQELTQHRVFRPASTPFIPEVPTVIDTDPIDVSHPKEHFNITVGPFLPDVELVSVTVGNQNLTLDDLKPYGYDIHTVVYPNGTIGFIIVVDVGAPFIKQQYLHDDIRKYTLNITLNFKLVPDEEVFTVPVVITVDVHDVVLPVMVGHCGDDAFYLMLKHGNLDHYWLPYVGDELLTFELAQMYGYMTMDNGTLFSLVVPFSSPGVIHEDMSLNEMQSRLDFKLKDNQTLEVYSNFTVRCTFSTTREEELVCFPNGTVAVTVKSTNTLPAIDISKLVLRDPTCGPKEQDGMKALFVFDINSCGTIGRANISPEIRVGGFLRVQASNPHLRSAPAVVLFWDLKSRFQFVKGFIIYENEISYPRVVIPLDRPIITRDPEYRLTILCRYPVNETLSIRARFGHLPAGFQVPESLSVIRQTLKSKEAQVLDLNARLARDLSYTSFYQDEDYPVSVHLTQPLYFEIELLYNENPSTELFLENCWATGSVELSGQPQWDIIVDGCENHMDTYMTTFHPVLTMDVKNPLSLKRFEVKTLASNNSGGLQGLVYFHCDVAVCDLSSLGAADGCGRRCTPGKLRGGRMINHSVQEFHSAVSSGPINIMTPEQKQWPDHKTSDGTRWKMSWVVLLAVGAAVVASVILLAVVYAVKSQRC